MRFDMLDAYATLYSYPNARPHANDEGRSGPVPPAPEASPHRFSRKSGLLLAVAALLVGIPASLGLMAD